jgi:DNA-binding transcriptional MerR regulator
MGVMDQRRLRIGQLAKRSGVSVDTTRYYERIGLMPKAARSASGYWEYIEHAINRVRLIQNALWFGFSLKEVRAFLKIRQAGGTPCQQVRAAATQILEAIEQRIAELTASRQAMIETVKQWDQKLSQTPKGQPAYLLEALWADDTSLRARRRPATTHQRW